MKLLPYRKIILHTSLTKDQCRETLRNNMVLGSPDSFSHSNPHNVNLLGTTYGDTFKACRIIDYRNSFAPIVYGQFRTVSDGTKTIIKFRMRDFVLVITIIWLSGTLLASIAGAISVISNNEAISGANIIPAGMFIIGMLLINMGFDVEYAKAKAELIQIFKAHDGAAQTKIKG